MQHPKISSNIENYMCPRIIVIISASQYFVPQIECTKNIHNLMLHPTLWLINYQIGLRTHRTIVHPNLF